MVMTTYTYESEQFQNMEKFILNEIKFSQENGYSPRAKRHMKRQLLREMNNVQKNNTQKKNESYTTLYTNYSDEDEDEEFLESDLDSDSEYKKNASLTLNEHKQVFLCTTIIVGYFSLAYLFYEFLDKMIISNEKCILKYLPYNESNNISCANL